MKTSSSLFTDALSELSSSYLASRPRSRELFDRATRVFPGGDTRSVTYFPPQPFYIDRAAGCRLIDVDGHEYIDLLNNYTMLVHGHNFPPVVEALREQSVRAMVAPLPNEPALRLAELICARFPSVELVRFTNSGTEAAMFAVRLARAFTGRRAIAKFEGGYHGTSDVVEVSVHPDLREAGPSRAPTARWEIPDMGQGEDSVLILPFNDPEAARARISAVGHDLACIVVEPVMGAAGMIPGTAELFAMLRETADHHGFLLIADEVITARLSEGGGQTYFGFRADLTILGKSIGGTLPAGAFGGRRDVMTLVDPRYPGGPKLVHSGTNNANIMAMIAGLVTLEHLGETAISRMNSNGEWLGQQIGAILAESGVEVCITGAGSMQNIHFTRGPVRSYRDAQKGNLRALQLLHLALLEAGVFIAPRGLVNVSTAVTDDDLATVVKRFREALNRLEPYLGDEELEFA